MGKAKLKQPRLVKSIHVSTDAQRRAWAVVDAVSELQEHLRPYRAIEALTRNEKPGSEESIDLLQRSDLAMLLCVLTSNVEQRCAAANEAAVVCAKAL